mgnify:CR=1 FL=1
MQGKLQRDGIPFFPPDAMDYGVKICPPNIFRSIALRQQL